MKVQDIMNRTPARVYPDTPVQEVARMLLAECVSAVPVVDATDTLVGLVSAGDVLYKKVRPHAPHYVNLFGASIYYGGIGAYNESFHKLLATEASELMTKVPHVITCTADTEVEEVASIMLEKHLKVLPVVEGTQLVGLITRTDIVRLIAQEG